MIDNPTTEVSTTRFSIFKPTKIFKLLNTRRYSMIETIKTTVSTINNQFNAGFKTRTAYLAGLSWWKRAIFWAITMIDLIAGSLLLAMLGLMWGVIIGPDLMGWLRAAGRATKGVAYWLGQAFSRGWEAIKDRKNEGIVFWGLFLFWSAVYVTLAAVALVSLLYLYRRSSIIRVALDNLFESVAGLPGRLWGRIGKKSPQPIKAIAGQPQGDEIPAVPSRDGAEKGMMRNV